MNIPKLLQYQFVRYCAIGVLNTIVHFLAFYLFIFVVNKQSVSNLIAFFVAASVSYLCNAKFTFNKKPSKKTFFLYIIGMTLFSFSLGHFADQTQLNPLITFVVFTLARVVIGFFYSKFIVFSRN